MKKYLAIFNLQTLIITVLCLVSGFLSVRYNFRIYADFLIFGIIIVFPITFTMREAFRRRERSIQYLSLLKASLKSIIYLFKITKMEEQKKAEIFGLARNVTDNLIQFLTSKEGDADAVHQSSAALGAFIMTHRKETKSNSFKIFSFVLRMNESVEFLMAVKRHHTPWGPRAIVLFTIYLFALFYPPAVLSEVGGIVTWNLFLMTVGKILILISLYNVQRLMEDTFSLYTPDAIRLDDFRITPESLSTENTQQNSIPNPQGPYTFNYDQLYR
ncbi:MAG TPA: hypothetical protein VLC28_02770 [Flavitalea sp.]|nr:hypothetical protein [Flavitalea sp.]